jgi:hypothetical protein
VQEGTEKIVKDRVQSEELVREPVGEHAQGPVIKTPGKIILNKKIEGMTHIAVDAKQGEIIPIKKTGEGRRKDHGTDE